MGFGSNPSVLRGGGRVGGGTSKLARQTRRGKQRVAGDREIIEIINLIGGKLAKKAMRKSLRKATKDIVLAEAINRVPFDTGQLEESLTVRAMKRSRSGFGYEVRVRKGSPAEEYAQVLEFGTKRVRAQPFLRVSGYSNEPRVLDLVLQDIRQVMKELPVSPIR